MRALESITGHEINFNPAYSYKFQLKTTFEEALALSQHY